MFSYPILLGGGKAEKKEKIPVPESLSDDGPSKDKEESKDEEKPKRKHLSDDGSF